MIEINLENTKKLKRLFLLLNLKIKHTKDENFFYPIGAVRLFYILLILSNSIVKGSFQQSYYLHDFSKINFLLDFLVKKKIQEDVLSEIFVQLNTIPGFKEDIKDNILSMCPDIDYILKKIPTYVEEKYEFFFKGLEEFIHKYINVEEFFFKRYIFGQTSDITNFMLFPKTNLNLIFDEYPDIKTSLEDLS